MAEFMLDDLKLISKIDKSSMLDTLAQFPEQIKETVDIVNSIELPSIVKIDNIIVNGMGGSAISGDIIQQFFRDGLEIPIFASSEYDLPKWANKDTLLLSQSYSGNTEETLSTFKYASQKRCKIIGISSGGKLQEYCENRKIPHIKIPSGLPPRTATAYLLFSSILALKKIGLLKDTIDAEIEETIAITDDFRKNNNKKVLEKDNISKQIAKTIFNTIPQVYGWGIYTPIARRWCTQFNENSKIIARYDIVPECNHNDIVGWSMNPEVSKKFTCILFRDEENESIHMAKRLNFMKDLFKEVVANVIEIQVKGKKRLAKMMYAMYLGDFVSCYLAVLREIDPTPVDVIVELKRALAEV
jgi:glucose/mannose-6-phosphate isomerase